MRRFPLEALLALRVREEEKRRGELAQACAAEAAFAAARDARRAELDARVAERRLRAVDPAAADARWLAVAARFDVRLRAAEAALRGALLGDEARLDESAARVARAREGLAAARRARGGVETRRERWAAAERRRQDRADEAAADDRASPAPAHEPG